ncbi:MAG: SBBP repeat-containing protein, partial [Dehalococcoidia bacterium]|nr:SBBP repeat-containing protein [Dehalococcoidia bacterium]
YATFLGGSGDDYGHGIAVDGSGAAYVIGSTVSSDFPTTPVAFDTSFGGDYDAFVVKLAIVRPPESLAIGGPFAGLVSTSYLFITSVAPISASVPITYVWQATGQNSVTHSSGLSDTNSFTWDTSGPKIITVMASNVADMVTGTLNIEIITPTHTVFLPLTLRGYSGAW